MGKESKQNIIHDSFEHGSNFDIGHFCIIEKGVQVGDNVTISNYVLLKKDTIIGNNVFIDSYVRFSGDCEISDMCTLRFGCTIARKTYLDYDVFVSPNVMTIYTDTSHKSKGGIVIGPHVFIGTAAVIGPGVKIGKDIVIGANSYVTKNCLDGKIYFGNPAKKIR